MSVNIKELRQLAQWATPGPWKHHSDGGVSARGALLAGCGIVPEYMNNAAFIAAANPATVLSLLERIESLTAERDELMADRLRQELEFLEHWMSHACNPVGQECCGRLQSGECCGSPDPIFMDGDKLTVDMAARHREVIALLNARLDAGKEN